MKDDKKIRESFKNFFEKKEHVWHESISLLPDDPSMLFTTAGMVQFKKQLLGDAGKLKRAASIQKCLRTTDIDEVGKTSRHLTFFEMYGNFSFGDYFKKEAVRWAWEFLTEVLSLDKDKLHATVFETDDEAFSIWEEILPKERIHRLGEKDNFWNMGDTGPCGPCSEILYDRGPERGCSSPDCAPGCSCDRYMEIWNLVFTQYDRQKDATLKDLPKKNIDTGMGLERLNQVLLDAESVYDTPTLRPLMEKSRQEAPNFNLLSARILADHSRAATFLIADGVSPSNEGKGYVLRRLIRRAAREGLKMGLSSPILWKYSSVAVDIFSDSYPNLSQRASHIALVLKKEEEAFSQTLESAEKILAEYIAVMKKEKRIILSAYEAFKLYDTYGMPADITKEILSEDSLEMDREGFERLLKERSKSTSWSARKAEDSYYEEIKDLQTTEFTGYSEVVSEAEVLRLLGGGSAIVLDKTPFYPESGGQTGDAGVIKGDNGKFLIEKTFREEGVIIHSGRLEGELRAGDKVVANVDCPQRRATERNHTATHILQSVLRDTLGPHVQQNGSYVGPDRLRFDFTHPAALSVDDIKLIEDKVNAQILSDIPVDSDEMSREAALEKGALAFFGEKYSDKVRMVSVGGDSALSMELCGGTHLRRTGEAGLFRVISESGIAAGVRRIEAVTGERALEYARANESILNETARLLKTPSDTLYDKVDKLLEELKETRQKINSLENKLASGGNASDTEKFQGDKALLLIREFPTVNAGVMRGWADQAVKEENTAAFAYSASDSKVSIILKLSDSLRDDYNAGRIISETARVIGGKGGGRADMAQGGGSDPSKLPEALTLLKSLF